MADGRLKACHEFLQEYIMSENSKRPRRSFSAELKQDTIYLPGKQGNSFKDAADVVGVMAKSLSDWHEKLAPESEPCDDDASTFCCRMGSAVSVDVCNVRKWNVKSKKATAYFAKESH